MSPSQLSKQSGNTALAMMHGHGIHPVRRTKRLGLAAGFAATLCEQSGDNIYTQLHSDGQVPPLC